MCRLMAGFYLTGPVRFFRLDHSTRCSCPSVCLLSVRPMLWTKPYRGHYNHLHLITSGFHVTRSAVSVLFRHKEISEHTNIFWD